MRKRIVLKFVEYDLSEANTTFPFDLDPKRFQKVLSVRLETRGMTVAILEDTE